MSTLKKNSIEILNDVGLCQDEEAGLFKKNCPHCYSEKVKIHSHYQTKENGERKMLLCQECKSYFAETHETSCINIICYSKGLTKIRFIGAVA